MTSSAPIHPPGMLTFGTGLAALLLPAFLADTKLAPYSAAIVALLRAAPTIIAEIEASTGPAIDAVRTAAPDLIPHLEQIGKLVLPNAAPSEQAHAAVTVMFERHRMTAADERTWFDNASRVF
jgi:hypothetical protein